ncbi:MAG: hypothetical protein RI556_04320 [Hydrogenovibrio sp.]|uniref:hypothetical protein n=1 Tax=Hydrogenovibrio sp. TaxID=2065821 RepID=UPI0028709FE1|nr:hypothetical protein [Hydrogenovibrio sp.]MDR9498379.1 hypothetical protein [Hydrogenovibrio sp.]
MFDYERELLFDEIHGLVPDAVVKKISPDLVEVSSALTSEQALKKLTRLVYAESIFSDKEALKTIQAQKESSCLTSGKTNRQSTRYGAHGLHDYKGKFNPQVVASLMNIFQADTDTRIIDPFCGSGTTLLESNYHGVESFGFDLNPLACFVSNTKASSVEICPNKIRESFKFVLSSLKPIPISETTDREIYLSKWFLQGYLKTFEALKFSIEALRCEEVKNVFKLLVSDILRDYSEQEPTDLRIRRRKSPYPSLTILEAFENAVNNFIYNLDQIRKVLRPVNKATAVNVDIRDDELSNNFNHYFDLALTSPPYATALPYIDTQRLSLVWLELVEPKNISKLERELIGSRDITKRSITKLRDQLSFEKRLPEELTLLCTKMVDSLNSSDGFRRQATPFVIYRYFLNMKEMFLNMSRVLKKNGHFALVVGTNSTTLGGIKFELDTPRYLQLIAENDNWEVVENRELQTYHRYGLHSKNASKGESLLILKNVID